MRLPKNRESGQALIMALILLGLGSLLVVPILNLSSTNLKYHQLIEGKTLEAYAADSGVQYALCELYNNPNDYADPGTPLELNFTINDRTVNVTAQHVGTGLYKITSTATSVNGRSTTIESCVNLSVGIFAFAVATKEDMTLENTTVDSSPDAGEGHIHSNMDISLTGCEIYGNATAVGTISGGEVYGIPTMGSSRVAFPQDYSQLWMDMAKGPNGNNIHPGDLTITSDRELGPLYISGNLFINGSETAVITVILKGTVYVAGRIQAEWAHLEGEQIVVADGDINIEAGGYGSEYIPIVISTGGNIILEKPAVDAVVYAPNGEVRFEFVHLYGAVGGERVYIENSTITYAQQLHGREDVPGGELHTITYSFR